MKSNCEQDMQLLGGQSGKSLRRADTVLSAKRCGRARRSEKPANTFQDKSSECKCPRWGRDHCVPAKVEARVVEGSDWMKVDTRMGPYRLEPGHCRS